MKTVNFRFKTSEERIKQAFNEGQIISNQQITIDVDPSSLKQDQRELLMRNCKYDSPGLYFPGSQTYNALTLEELIKELLAHEQKAREIEEREAAQRVKEEEEQAKEEEKVETLRILAVGEGLMIQRNGFDYFNLANKVGGSVKAVSDKFRIFEEEGAHETFAKMIKSYRERKEKQAKMLKDLQDKDDLKVRVAEWIAKHGSRLAKLRLKHNFEYMKLAGREDVRRIIAKDPLLSDFKIVPEELYNSMYSTNQDSEPPLKLLEEFDVLAGIEILNSLNIEYRHEDDDTEYWITARLNVVSGVEVVIAKPM